MFDSLWRSLGLDRESTLIRRMHHSDPYTARSAIFELARLPCSEAIINALDGSARSSWCIEALGEMADERASAVLVRKLAQDWNDRDDACRALSHARHDPAVPELERLALGATDYHVVAAAVKALTGIGTPWAVSALERFRHQPARQLQYYENNEDYALVSSERLGQGAIAESRAAEQAAALARDPVSHASDAGFAALLARWRTHPNSIVAERPGLVECMRAPADHPRRAAIAAALAGADQAAVARALFDRLGEAEARQAFELLTAEAADRALLESCRAIAGVTPAALGGWDLLARRRPAWAGPEIAARLLRDPDGINSTALLRILPPGYPAGLAPYTAGLKSDNWLTRRAAVVKLCQSPTPEARAALEKHLATEPAVEVAHLIRRYLEG